MRIFAAATLLLALFSPRPTVGSQSSSESRELQDRLNAEVTNYYLSEASFVQALIRIAAEFEIPMGIEWVRQPETLQRVEFSWPRATGYQVLEAVVHAQPGYHFELHKGIVHVFAREFLTDKQNFLDLRLDRFEVQNEFVGVASDRLRQRVQQIIRPRVEPPASLSKTGGVAGSRFIGWGDERTSFRLENVAVRDVLDKLLLSAGFRVWIVTYLGDSTRTRSGFRRVSGANGDRIPESGQPVWQLLLRGYDPILGGLRQDWRFRTPSAKSNN